ncbi:MAG: DNA mismatch repair protein MutS, partial [Prochlorococcaceae cyanobacterium]
MAAEAEQQLSLVPEATVQGSLFAEPPAASPNTTSPAAPSAAAPAATANGLDPEALAADAAARPRKRPPQRRPPSRTGTNTAAPASPAAAPAPPTDTTATTDTTDTDSDSDLPPWHHHDLVDLALLPPVLRHYVELKRAHPERLLLYRLGDFFECFFEDAITVSRLLELTLTGKEGGKAIGRVPMAGIPHHAAERYCGELVRRGLSVALCDQLEEASARSQGRGELLRRDITRVITPGTVLEEGMLAARRNNWLCAVVLEGPAGAGGSAARWGLAVADVSTGEFRVSERRGSDALHQELLQLEAAEVLWPGGAAGDTPAAAPAWSPAGLRLTRLPRTPFEAPEASATLRQRFNLASLDGLGLGEVPLALRAAGGLVHYLDGTQNGTSAGPERRVPLDLPTTWHAGDALVLDAATRRNLELTRTQLGGSLQGSLLWAIDRTHTAMGGRCLRRWLEAPLVERAAILERQDGVSELVGQRPLRLAIRRLL